MTPLTAALVRAVVWILQQRCGSLRTDLPDDCPCRACTLRREVEREASS